MEKSLKEYESCLQGVYDKHVALLPDSETIEPDKGNKYLIPFSAALEIESNRIGEILVPKLVLTDRNDFIDKSRVVYKAIYQKYMNRLEEVKTSISDTQNAIFQP